MKKSRIKPRIFLFLLLIILCIVSNLSLSMLGSRYTEGSIYRMMDDFYRIAGFMDAFDACEKSVGSYRWSEEQIYDQEQDRLIRDCLSQMEGFLEQMVQRMTVEAPNQYHDIRALSHMFPHYQGYMNGFLEQMEAGMRAEALSSYYQREQVVSLIHDYSFQMLNDTVQESQKDYSRTQRVARILWLFQVLAGMAAVMLSAYFAAMLYEIVQPVSRLVEASEAMGNENFDIPDVPVGGRNTELHQLTVSFNHMKHSTRQYVETLKAHNQTLELLRETEKQALESQRLAEQARLLSLRGQVNPHFLFNALNTIRRIAQREHAAQTEGLILSLAKVFRHSLDNNHTLSTLADEMEVTQQYFKLQQARFEDRIRLEWDVSDEIEPEELMIPSFVLQTLVENAVKHGLEPKEEGGTVKICLRIEGEFLKMTVTDDGAGMSPEILESVQKGERPEGTASGIGLNNLYHRLRILNQGNQLRIWSQKDHGTEVTIQVPVQCKEEGQIC